MTSDYVTHKNKRFDHGDTSYPVNIKCFENSEPEYVWIDWEPRKPFPVMTDHLAKHYNMKAVNLSMPGASNRMIFDKAVDYLLENHESIGMMNVNWTGVERYELISPYHSDGYLVLFGHGAVRKGLQELIDLLRKIGFFEDKQIKYNSDLRCMFLMQELCDYYEVPHVESASLNNGMEYADHLLNSKCFDMINEDTFYGWPIERNIGGDHLCRDVVGLTKYDNHPNEEDHKMMAERLRKFIDDIS